MRMDCHEVVPWCMQASESKLGVVSFSQLSFALGVSKRRKQTVCFYLYIKTESQD